MFAWFLLWIVKSTCQETQYLQKIKQILVYLKKKLYLCSQFIEVSITKRRNNMRAMRIADDVTSVKK